MVHLLRWVVVLVAVQFLLGIWVNLFGSFPSTSDVVTALSFTGDPVLTAHYVLAVVLLLLSIVIVLVAFRSREAPAIRWCAVGGFLSILWAYESGIQFILSGFSNNVDSFLMAVGFIASTVFYGVAQVAALVGGPRSTDGTAGIG